MADVLSQSEVDALLQAVSGGDDAAPAPDLGGGLGDLGGADFGGGAAASAPAANIPMDTSVTVYDFKRPNRVSPEQMRALSSLHEQFARNLGVELTGVLRSVIDIQTSQAEQLTYQEFTMSLPNPTYITTLSCEPLSGEMIIELNPTICFPFIDKLLGGGHSSSVSPERTFTDIESRLISQIMDNVIHHLQETWDPIGQLRFNVTDTETNPQILQNVAPNEIVVLLTFEIRMSEGEAGGMLNLCIPFNVIEPVIGKLSSQSWSLTNSKMNPQDLKRLKSNVQDVPINVEAYIAESTIRASELATLKPGDIITTPKIASQDIMVNIGGRPKFKASIGQIRGHKAVRIEEAAEDTDKINF
jgi:flagellar motor switch protein FliM